MSGYEESTGKPIGDGSLNNPDSQSCSLHSEWVKDFHKQRKAPLELDKNGQYTVNCGDTLWTIAERTLSRGANSKITRHAINHEVKELVKANKTQYPHLYKNLLAGMKLVVPEAKHVNATPLAGSKEDTAPQKPEISEPNFLMPKLDIMEATGAAQQNQVTFNQNTPKPTLGDIGASNQNTLKLTLEDFAAYNQQNIPKPTLGDIAVSGPTQQEEPAMSPDDLARASMAQAGEGSLLLTPQDMEDPEVRKTVEYVAGGMGVAIGIGLGIATLPESTVLAGLGIAARSAAIETLRFARGFVNDLSPLVSRLRLSRVIKPEEIDKLPERLFRADPEHLPNAHPAPSDIIPPEAVVETPPPKGQAISPTRTVPSNATPSDVVVEKSTGLQFTVQQIREAIDALQEDGDTGSPTLRFYKELLKQSQPPLAAE